MFVHEGIVIFLDDLGVSFMDFRFEHPIAARIFIFKKSPAGGFHLSQNSLFLSFQKMVIHGINELIDLALFLLICFTLARRVFS